MSVALDNLLYKSGLTAQGCWDSMDDYDREAIMKFAELIVKECVKNLETNKRCDIYTGELIDCERNDVIQHQIVSLIEHFGVEQ